MLHKYVLRLGLEAVASPRRTSSCAFQISHLLGASHGGSDHFVLWSERGPSLLGKFKLPFESAPLARKHGREPMRRSLDCQEPLTALDDAQVRVGGGLIDIPLGVGCVEQVMCRKLVHSVRSYAVDSGWALFFWAWPQGANRG